MRHLFRNKKNGKVYQAICELADQTNGREGQRMVVYQTLGAKLPEYVRDAKEFGRNFEELEEYDATGKLIDYSAHSAGEQHGKR